MAVVKWVCSECGTNNMGYTGGILQCTVCGRIRTGEAVDLIDEGIVDLEGLSRRDVPSLSVRNADQLMMLAIRHFNKLLPAGLVVTLIFALVYAAILGITGKIQADAVFHNLCANIAALLGGHRISSPFAAFYRFTGTRVAALPETFLNVGANTGALLALDRLLMPLSAAAGHLTGGLSGALAFRDRLLQILARVLALLAAVIDNMRLLLHSLISRIVSLIQEI